MMLCSTSHPLNGQFLEAIATLDFPHCQALLDAGAQVNAMDPLTGLTALITAVRAGDVDLVQLLIAKGADVDGQSDRHLTPLMQAASQGNAALVGLLLEQSAQVQLLSRDGDTALSLAAGATHWQSWHQNPTELAEHSEAEGTKAQATDNFHHSRIRRQTPDGIQVLVPLPEAQVIAVVKQLIAAGADVNQANCSATPLMEAVRYGQLCLLAYLLDQGACPNLPANDGQTALNIARIYNQARALTLLEAHQLARSGNADVDSTTARTTSSPPADSNAKNMALC